MQRWTEIKKDSSKPVEPEYDPAGHAAQEEPPAGKPGWAEVERD
jgi:hypothetical protein